MVPRRFLDRVGERIKRRRTRAIKIDLGIRGPAANVRPGLDTEVFPIQPLEARRQIHDILSVRKQDAMSKRFGHSTEKSFIPTNVGVLVRSGDHELGHHTLRECGKVRGNSRFAG